MKKILLGVAIGFLVAAFLFTGFQPSPEPVIITVKEVVKEGVISGQTNIHSPQIDPKESVVCDFKVVVPVVGEFATENANVKVSGETFVERTGDLLLVDTIFHDAEINVKYKPPPEPPRKNWHVGAYFVTDFDSVRPGGFVQRDFLLSELFGVEVEAFGRVEMDVDVRAMVGVQARF